MEIRITENEGMLTSQDLKQQLEKLPKWDKTITLEVHQDQSASLRTIDPTVLAAVFTMTGTALGALITGILQIMQANRKERITLVTKDGLRIEIEAKHAQDKIPELINLLKSMEVDLIKL